MADPNSNVPDYDDIPIPTLDEMLMVGGSFRLEYEGVENQPIGENILINEDMNQFGHDHPTGENIMLNVDRNQFAHDHPLGENIMLDANMNQFGHGTSQASTSRVNDQSNSQVPGMFDPEISNIGDPIQLPEWPVPAKPYSCSCCQVLREIIHTIEGESRKFEIHGRLGMIFHGILEICRGNMTAPNKEYHFFEESTDRVKMFLEEYCEKQKMAGYSMVKDPIWTFYQAVSVGFDWNLGLDDINDFDFFHGSPIHIGDMGQPNVPEPQAPNVPPPQAPNVPQLQAPNVPRNQAPNVPRTQAPNVPQPQAPNVPQLQTPNVPRTQAPNVPQLQAPNVPRNQAPNVPRPQAPNVPQLQAPNVPQNQAPNVPRPQAPNAPQPQAPRRPYSEQRKRTKTLSMHDFAPYLHLTQNEAARRVGVSPSVCKNIRGDAGLARWPHRKINSLRKKIEVRSRSLNAANPAERARAEADIQNLRRELATYYPPYR